MPGTTRRRRLTEADVAKRGLRLAQLALLAAITAVPAAIGACRLLHV